MRLLWRINHEYQRVSKRMHRVLGVSGPQRLVLRMLGQYPVLTAGRLASILHVHPSTLTPVLDELERDGLVAREADPRDTRRALLHLTAKGHARDTMTPGTIEDAIRETLCSLGQEPRRALARSMTLLADSLEARASASYDARKRAGS
jgi:DNA-binding MarR family transcriptional regulator